MNLRILRFCLPLCFFTNSPLLLALNVDYGLGLTTGLAQDLLKADARMCKQTFDPKKWNYTNQAKCNNNYSFGFFLQTGLSHNPWVNWGVEYSFSWINHRHLDSFNSTKIIGDFDEKRVIDTSLTKKIQRELVQNNLDLYYRFNLNDHILPVAVQFNCGISLRHALCENINSVSCITTTIKQDGNFNISQKRESANSHKKIAGTGVGLHLGMRLNVCLFFIGADYIFHPNFNIRYPEEVAGLAYSYKEQRQHAFTGTVGILINKTILDQWTKQ